MTPYGGAFRVELAAEAKRCRWDLDMKAGKGTKVFSVGRDVVLKTGVRTQVFDVFAVDITRDGRDVTYGTPVLLNDIPIPFLGEAAEFAIQKMRGGRTYHTWRGAQATLVGEPRLPPRRVVVEDVAPRNLRGV